MRQPTRDFLRRATAVVSLVAMLARQGTAAPIPINSTGSYTQNFNTLPSTGSVTWANDSTLTGWWAQRTGTGTSIVANTGTTTAGDLYSFGTSASSDRALGSIGSGGGTAGHFAWGVQFQNTGSGTATLGTLQYVGEQWRNGGNTSPNVITVWYSIGSSALTSVSPGTSNTGWTALTALDFSSPINTTTAAVLDGNAAANRTARSSNLGLALNPGQFVMFRWSDPDHSGTDHGLAIDDFQLAWTYSSPPPAGNLVYWDANGTSAGVGGTGTWTSSSPLFSSDENGTDATTRTDGSGVAFTGSAGTVTVTDTVTANAGLSFATTGYTLTGGTISLGGADAAANTITTAAGTATTITSTLVGANGLTKAGPGTLVLDGVNTYAGGTIVSAGTLVGTTSSLQGTITNNGELRFEQAGPGTYAGVINGSGSLTKAGPGNVTLSGANTFTGPVTINGGVLSVGSQANLGGGSAVNIDGGTLSITGTYSSTTGAAQAFTVGASGGTLEVAAGVTASKLGSQLLGPGTTLTKTGAGTLALTTSGTSTIGTLNVNAGSFRITSNRIGSIGALNVGSGGTFWIDDTTAITTLGMATGATLSFAGDGQDGSGAYRHSLDEVGNAATTIPQPISLPSTARFTLVNRGSETVTDTFSGVISGPGGLIKDGSGTMILSGTNTHAGGTTVAAGRLSVSADSNLGAAAGGITLGGGTLEMTTGFTLGAGRTITAATGTSSSIAVTAGTVSFAGPFTGSGDLDKTGPGTLAVGNASSGYTGSFTISAGTLAITAADAFANATLTKTGGTLLLAPQGGGDVVLPQLGGSGGTVTVEAGVNAVFGGNSNRAYAGQINGLGGLKKQGQGTLTLNGNNPFNGPTRIEAGSLRLGGGGALTGTPSIDVDSGAFFDLTGKMGFTLGTGQRLGGRGTVLGDLQFGGGSQLAFDATGPILIGSGTVSFAAGFGIASIFGLNSSVAEGTYTLLDETTGGAISFTNLANVGPGSAFDLGAGKSAYFQQGSLQVVVVPEPEAFLLGALGLAIAGFAAARRPVTRRAAPGG